MNSSNRRIDPRVNVRVPLRFRILNGQESTEQTADAENISQRGIYFTTAVPMKVGMPVEVSLRMPQELGEKTSSDVRCIARVVRIQTNSVPAGKVGVGLHIERYEAVAAVGNAGRIKRHFRYDRIFTLIEVKDKDRECMQYQF